MEPKVRDYISTMQRLPREKALLSELKAIEHWDRSYWRTQQPECWETQAFENRQRRRDEILRTLAVEVRNPKRKVRCRAVTKSEI